MDRRSFLTALAAGTAAAVAGCSFHPPGRGEPAGADENGSRAVSGRSKRSIEPIAGSLGQAGAAPSHNHLSVYRADSRTISVLPDVLPPVSRVALTIDDGVSTHVVSAYIDFLKNADLRATFFVTAVYESWTALRSKLAPLVHSGQIQLANHTWDHPSITRLSEREIASQLIRTETFLWKTYGVRGAPYFRPPYGRHDARTDAVAADLGFTDTVLWFGSFGDAAPLTGQQILTEARRWLQPGRIVIGHANHPGVTTIYPQLLELIRQRSLHTVTLHDAFAL